MRGDLNKPQKIICIVFRSGGRRPEELPMTFLNHIDHQPRLISELSNQSATQATKKEDAGRAV